MIFSEQTALIGERKEITNDKIRTHTPYSGSPLVMDVVFFRFDCGNIPINCKQINRHIALMK